MAQSPAAADLNLLYGMLALQMDFISRDQLLTAMGAWVLDKSKTLGAILIEQKVLAPDRHALLQALMQEHIKQHGNDPQQSLAAVSSVGSVDNELKKIADADVQASLISRRAGEVPRTPRVSNDDPYATASVGASTSTGLRFRILRPHAKGGLGEVFVAHDQELHREVALKEIQDRHADNPESRSRFLLEAEITGGLEHPGIVPVYGLGQYADGRPFYAMRFIKGDSLQDAIEKYHGTAGDVAFAGSSLELRKLLGRFIDVCEAIQYAHDRGVLHRDLKPGNIMLGKYGETLVVDWGLAKARGESKAATSGVASPATIADEPALRPQSASVSAETQVGSAVGTPAYMSPEQAAGRLDLLGPASDVYSLGATLYYLLTGQVPFTDKDVVGILAKVQRGGFPPPRQIKPAIPPALDAICLKAMALKGPDRYASARALADDVEHWLADEPVGVWSEPWTARAARWARRHRTVVTSASVALVLAIVGTVTVLFLEQRRMHEARQYLASLKSSAENEDQLAAAELRAGRFASADAILEQVCRRLQDEPQLEALRVDLQARQQRVHRLVEFYRLADNLEQFIFEKKVVQARDAGEEALGILEVTRHEDWWTHLPDADLTPPQCEHLRDTVYRQLLLIAALRVNLKADAKLRSALELLTQAERFRPSQSGYLLARACRFALGEGKQDKTLPTEAPTSAVDHYFLGFLHWAKATQLDNSFCQLIFQGQDHHTGILDLKAPLAKSEEHFRTALQLEPRHPFTYLFLWNTLMQAKRYPEAELAVDASIGLRPEFAPAYYARAATRLKQVQVQNDPRLKNQLLDRASADASQAIHFDANFTEAYQLRGFIHEVRQEHEKAMADFGEAIRLDPKNAFRRNNRGFQFYKHKQYDQAIADYDEAIRLEPDARWYNNRGVAFFFKKDYVKALADLNEAIKLNPVAANPYNHRGKTQRMLRNPDKAVVDLNEAIRLNPRYAEAHSSLAWLLATYPDAKIRDGKKAIDCATRACELTDWKEPHFLATLAAAYAEAGQGADAVRRQQQALALPNAFAEDELPTERLRLKLYQDGKALHLD